jgi:dTDP-4-dehydrorhamnose 3,5-epimerase
LNFIRTTIPDVIICEPEIFADERGYFVETFREDKLENFLGYKVNFCQDSESKSSYGVLRGLHYQIPPYAQSKLVRVIKGKVLDIAVDIRQGSPTFGRYTAVELSEENKKQLFIPIGFAHGFVVLSEDAIFTYKVDSYYCPKCERGIAFDDKDIDINWQINQSELQLSLKDTKQPKFKDIKKLFKFESNYYV